MKSAIKLSDNNVQYGCWIIIHVNINGKIRCLRLNSKYKSETIKNLLSWGAKVIDSSIYSKKKVSEYYVI